MAPLKRTGRPGFYCFSIILLFVFVSIFAGCALQYDLDHKNKSEAQIKKVKDIYKTGKKYQVKISKIDPDKAEKPAESGVSREIKSPETDKARRVMDILPPVGGQTSELDAADEKGNKDKDKKDSIPFSIQLEDADIRDFLDIIIGDFIGGSYILEAKPAQKISINMHGNFTNKNMLATLKIILDSMSLTLARHHGVYHVLPNKKGIAIAENIQVLIVSPKYIKVVNLITILKDLKSSGGKIATIQGSNILFMLDYPENLERARALINLFDAPFFKDRYVRVYSLKTALAQDVSEELNSLVKEYNVFSNKEPVNIRIIPIKRLKKIVILATSLESLEYLDSWIGILDQERDDDEKISLFTYRPKYSKVKDLVNLLNKIFPKLKNNEDGLEAFADNISNMLILRAQKKIWLEAREIIVDVDKQPGQVYIQAVLAEIKLDQNMQMGFQWWLQHEFFGYDDLVIGSTMGDLTNEALKITVSSGEFFGLLAERVNDGEASIIATPHILVKHEEEASIEIKREVPVVKDFLKTDQQVDGTTSDKPSIEYKDAGIILKVKTRIINRSDVEINIEQEVSEPRTTTVAGIDTYEFNTRKIMSDLILKDQQTILIGGLISELHENSDTRIPILSDIPLLKYMFTSKSKKTQRSELVLFLTPVIVSNSNELQAFTNNLTAILQNNIQDEIGDVEKAD
ncbi:general secretion pathway protein D [Desulfosarcina sp. BuS5]|uniref:secretin N-terminal domain-containing protein n=1 Tax=Desulfosarcina sp. BuS5 TaxID=933262 RepID=UPI000487DCAC|nr:secretin N-terminal domain-containing protein [Desulfosarcina sp. BuS5]WDN90716.1 general secretion pathway protein D [Desulfosarcina sp. BuS5]